MKDTTQVWITESDLSGVEWSQGTMCLHPQV